MGIVVLVLVVAALLGLVVWIARRSDARPDSSFWPKSSAGQLGAVAVGLLVVGLLASMASW